MKVAVALSGGVDSAVTLCLLKKNGHDPFALFMKNWQEKGKMGRCLFEKDFEDAQRICQTLNVPLYEINFSKEYWERVFVHFIKEIQLGYTPNPDILCNREIKFKLLLKKAQLFGADVLATGHYCQIKNNTLLKGRDKDKDQSYFLYTLKKHILSQILFPVGHMHKSEVRKIAQQENLPVFAKRDSTGICFIGKRNFRRFLERYIPNKQGVIETEEGKNMGTHHGIYYYTIGQRKGIGLGGAGEAYFVTKKNLKRNALIVAQGANHPSLFASSLIATDISWIDTPPTFPMRCYAKIRYRQIDQPCTVKNQGTKLHVAFDTPQRAIAPRQSVVFYQGEHCLGGAIIEQALSTPDF